VKTVQRAPSAKRADQCPIGTTSSRPLSFRYFTIAPSVSRCAIMARAPFCSTPGMRARIAPRRVSSYSTPSRPSSSQA